LNKNQFLSLLKVFLTKTKSEINFSVLHQCYAFVHENRATDHYRDEKCDCVTKYFDYSITG